MAKIGKEILTKGDLDALRKPGPLSDTVSWSSVVHAHVATINNTIVKITTLNYYFNILATN